MMTIVLDAAYDMMEGGDPLWDRLTAEVGQLGSDALARRDLYVKLVEQALSARATVAFRDTLIARAYEASAKEARDRVTQGDRQRSKRLSKAWKEDA